MRAAIALANRCRKRVGILTGGSITENPSQCHLLFCTDVGHTVPPKGV